jgi:hypothetical protein
MYLKNVSTFYNIYYTYIGLRNNLREHFLSRYESAKRPKLTWLCFPENAFLKLINMLKM